jgi:hypothetical protein
MILSRRGWHKAKGKYRIPGDCDHAESLQSAPARVIGRPESLSRAAASGDRMNQTEQIKFVGHGRDLAADSVQGDEQSALHARNCNMLPKTSLAKPEVSTLQKTGSFYFALTFCQVWTGVNPNMHSEEVLGALGGMK